MSISAPVGHEFVDLGGFTNDGNATVYGSIGVLGVPVVHLNAFLGEDGVSVSAGGTVPISPFAVIASTASYYFSPSKGLGGRVNMTFASSEVAINDEELISVSADVAGIGSVDLSGTEGGTVKLGGVTVAAW